MLRHDEEIEKIKHINEITNLLSSDVTSCGKMLSEANEILYLKIFEHMDEMFTVRNGTDAGVLTEALREGETEIEVPLTNGPPSRLSKILIYDKETSDYEINTIREYKGGRLILKKGLGADYREGSVVVVFNHIVWRFSRDRLSLSRVVNGRRRYKLPLTVTDFSVTYYPESVSVLYRIEIDKKDQVRGYLGFANAPPEPPGI